MENYTQETLDAMKNLNVISQDIAKAYSQATGLVWYDLEPAAKLLYPVITPLRNKIPRVSGDGGTATNWKSITGISMGNAQTLGVGEGQRNASMSVTVVDKVAAYKGIGLEDDVTFEADYAAKNFDDVKSLAVLNLLRNVMIGEEKLLLGGNNSLALGVTPTPSVSTSTTGGSLTNATYNVICVALTLEAMRNASVSGGVPTSGNRTNNDGTVTAVKGGTAGKSTAASQATTGSTSTISASVTAVNGAAGYAWYWGTSGNELLGAITPNNSLLITAAATGTQNASAISGTDNSQNSLIFDGLMTQIMSSGSGSYVFTAATGTPGTGTAFTSDGAGGITEIETAFAAFWDNYKLSPDEMYVSGRTALALNKLIIANGGAPLIRFAMDAGGQTIVAGTVIGSYMNKITNKAVVFIVHPDIPDGTVLFYSRSIPYPLNGVANILQVKARREYYQVEWPLRTRKYEYGVYADQVLQNYFTPAFGLLRNYKV